jgi:hypothetical protein
LGPCASIILHLTIMFKTFLIKLPAVLYYDRITRGFEKT